ncbi:MAG: acylphosphatase [Pseudomonadota bacterium]
MPRTMCKKYLIEGQVQGVGFRMATQAAAREIGLDGWVKNLPRGGVEAAACGEQERVVRFEAFLRKGPRFAFVQSVLSEPYPCNQDYGFNIT